MANDNPPTSAYMGGKILIVDDEASNVVLLERMLGRAGYTFLTSTTDSREALRLFRETNADLILLDLMMPYVDGYAVMEQIEAALPPGTYVPILVLTADVTPNALRRALSAGAKDFLTKPFDQTELLLRVKNLLETRFLYLGLQHQVVSLEYLNEQAEDAIRVRSESLSEISHDLGQPLAGLRMTTQALRLALAEEADPRLKGLAGELDYVDAAADQLADMIAELSDVARVQIGRKLVLRKSPTDLVALTRKAVDDLKRTTRRHRFRCETERPEVIGDWDAVRIKRVITNLLTNAIKYSPTGGEIAVSIASALQDGVEVAQVSVRDEGIGIAADDLPHVFERYYRGRNVGTEIAGAGIGLAGVKQIVEQHGGSISVSSVEGEGTTVTIELPVSATGQV